MTVSIVLSIFNVEKGIPVIWEYLKRICKDLYSEKFDIEWVNAGINHVCFSIIFFLLGIQSIYFSKSIEEIRKRPLYIVREKNQN
jgi:alpha-galactosidase/6-phospho-beta-glucosidase family protein